MRAWLPFCGLSVLGAFGTLACTYNTYVVSDGGTSGTDSGTPAPNVNFFLQSVLAPPSGSNPQSGCFFTSDPTQGILSKGILDVEVVKSFADTYEATFLAANQFAANGKTASEIDASRLVIQGAIVRITDSSGKKLADYTTLGSGFLNPSNGGTPGYGYVQLTIVDPATIDSLRAQLAPFERETIVTHTQALGQTLGGQHVASNTFEFEITACKGCLIQFDTDKAKTPIPNCFALAPVTAPPSVCFAGQDAPVDCHVCYLDPFCLCGRASCK